MCAAVFFGFLFALAVCYGQCENCEVFPKDPVVRMGSDIEITFKGPHRHLCSNVPSYDPRKMTWVLNGKKIDKSSYRVINSTIAAVVIRNFTLRAGTVMCHMEVDGKEIVLGGTTVKAFSPPKKPTNISCITIFEKSFTCYWDNGCEANTSYTIFWESDFLKDACTSNCSPCIFANEVIVPLNILVKAQNAFGATRSDIIRINPLDTVKLQAPEEFRVTPHFNRLLVKWKRPANTQHLNVTCEVLYQYRKEGSWVQRVKSLEMGAEDEEGVADIKVEQICTWHNVSVRCKLLQSLWGFWSQSHPVHTSLDVNDIKFHLWRKIHTADKEGNRTVLLMWKGVPSSCSAVHGYRITVINLKSNSCAVDDCATFLTKSSNQFNLIVGHEEHKITITAYKNTSTFSEDSVIVPAVGDECPPVKNVSTVAIDNQITVRWTAPSRPVSRYMIDWSAGTSGTRWHDSRTAPFTLEDELQKLYRIAVTPLYDNCTGQESMLLAYAKEGAPGDIASVEVSDVQESSARISWTPVPPDKCCGFVRNYTVSCVPDKGATLGECVEVCGSVFLVHSVVLSWAEVCFFHPDVTVNSSVHQVHLHHLQHTTMYTVSVVAKSDGGQSVITTSFMTNRKGRTFPRPVSALGGLFLILFIAIGIFVFIMFSKTVKVPSPQFSSLVLWPDQLYKKDKNVSKLFIPECSEHIAHSLVIFPLDLDVEGISPAPGEDDHPGSLAKQLKCFADDSKTRTETGITAPPSALLLNVHESSAVTTQSGDAGEMPQGRNLGDNEPTGPCFKTPVGRKERLSEGTVQEKDRERQHLPELQGNVPQAYVTMDLFDQSQAVGM
ncbi:interleukin-6 receptor subunit beta-like isoform X1 [Arapaima gigas]